MGASQGTEENKRTEFVRMILAKRASSLGSSELRPSETCQRALPGGVSLGPNRESSAESGDQRQIRQLSLLSTNLRATADAVSGLKRHENLFEDTGMAPSSVGDQLCSVARVVGQRLNGLPREFRSWPRPETSDPCLTLIEILGDLLRPSQALAFTNMLRLQQALEAYFKNSADETSSRLYDEAKGFLAACETTVRDLRVLGINFHSIRFLAPLDGQSGNVHDNTGSLPYLHRNKRLLESIRRKTVRPTNYWGTVADVDQWGFECLFDPELSRQSQVWCWRAGALQAAEIS